MSFITYYYYYYYYLFTLAKVIMAEPLWQKTTDAKTKKAKQKSKLSRHDNQIGRNSESTWSLDYDP
jgi:hypothetical protein